METLLGDKYTSWFWRLLYPLYAEVIGRYTRTPEAKIGGEVFFEPPMGRVKQKVAHATELMLGNSGVKFLVLSAIFSGAGNRLLGVA
jgi:hypothetical protein